MREIGVVAALPDEARAWSIPDTGHAVRVEVSGPGARRAACCAERLLERGVTALVNWGVAGGLSHALQPGDLVLVEQIQSDAGTEISTPAWNRALLRAWSEIGVDALPGRLWTHERVVADTQEKSRLAARGHDIVDMEAAAVARVAREGGVPFVAIKSVCDPASRSLPVFAPRLLREDGSVRAGALVPLLWQGPRAWRALRWMRADFAAACAALRGAAEAVVTTCPD